MNPRPRKPSSFVDRHGLWTGAQVKAAADVEKIIKKEKLEVVRFSFADQHGVLRGKTLLASEAPSAMRAGVTMTTTLLAKDTAHRTVYPVFTPGGGFAMFRRLKIRLGHLRWPAIRRAVRTGKPMTVTLRLTDDAGGPLCATPPASHIRWDVG